MMTFVIFLLFIHESQHASAAVVQAYEKEPSILLPCQFYDHFTMMPEDPIVSWIRSDLNPKNIHQLTDEGDDFKEQNVRYRGRTSMKTKALDSGDFSLTLRKPQMSDSGTYTCTIWTGREWLRLTEIQLQVKDDQVVVKGLEGAESVRLPCKTSPHLPEDARVEWIHLDSERMAVHVVHVHQNKSDDLTTQDRSYCGRTEMNKDLLKTGDLSLTIKYPTERDSGTYICMLYVKGDSTKQRVDMHHVKDNALSWIVVLLIVMSAGFIVTLGFVIYIKFCFKSADDALPDRMEVESEVESVQLLCKAPSKVTKNAFRVKWTNGDMDFVGSNVCDEEVCLFYRHRSQLNEDFSLTLKYPTDQDNSTYTCTIYNRDNELLLTKQVELKVKVCEVEVEEGAESVLLPFRTTPDLPEDTIVTWFHHSNNLRNRVYVYPKDSSKKYKMNENPLGSGDASLILKDPKVTDSGKYRCHLRLNDAALTKTTIYLNVKGTSQRVDMSIRSSSSIVEDHPVAESSV